ncbi:hypothetical protein [Clostridium sp. AM43-3BH]|uniref:hypothetical protein n=1 Tax=unclassified Clostridium TaxID=2614128 RepID=UPI00325B525F
MLMPSGAIGFEKLLDQTGQTGFGSEFLDEEKSCIGGEVAAAKIYFHTLIAFKGCSG